VCGMLVFVLLIVVLQLCLLTATMNEGLGDDAYGSDGRCRDRARSDGHFQPEPGADPADPQCPAACRRSFETDFCRLLKPGTANDDGAPFVIQDGDAVAAVPGGHIEDGAWVKRSQRHASAMNAKRLDEVARAVQHWHPPAVATATRSPLGVRAACGYFALIEREFPRSSGNSANPDLSPLTHGTESARRTPAHAMRAPQAHRMREH
jgi:hypothetical protein